MLDARDLARPEPGCGLLGFTPVRAGRSAEQQEEESASNRNGSSPDEVEAHPATVPKFARTVNMPAWI
jgi:hypothetical protein